MNSVKSWYALTRGGHLVNAGEAINGDARIWFCPSCRGRLILHTGNQKEPAWFEHDQRLLTAEMRLTCALLNPEPSPSPLLSHVACLSPLPVAQSWYCVLCERHYQREKFCTSCGSGIYSTEEPLRQELSPESESRQKGR